MKKILAAFMVLTSVSSFAQTLTVQLTHPSLTIDRNTCIGSIVGHNKLTGEREVSQLLNNRVGSIHKLTLTPEQANNIEVLDLSFDCQFEGNVSLSISNEDGVLIEEKLDHSGCSRIGVNYSRKISLEPLLILPQ